MRWATRTSWLPLLSRRFRLFWGIIYGLAWKSFSSEFWSWHSEYVLLVTSSFLDIRKFLHTCLFKILLGASTVSDLEIPCDIHEACWHLLHEWQQQDSMSQLTSVSELQWRLSFQFCRGGRLSRNGVKKSFFFFGSTKKFSQEQAYNLKAIISFVSVCVCVFLVAVMQLMWLFKL